MRVCAIGTNLSAIGFRSRFGLVGDRIGAACGHTVDVVGYAWKGASAFADVVIGAPRDCALSFSQIHNTGDVLVIGLPNSLVTIGLVRLSTSAGLVGVLTGIAGGIPGVVTTGSIAR